MKQQSAPEVKDAGEAGVGFTVVTTKAVFDKLLRMAGGKQASLHSWSNVITKLIEKAP